MPVPPPVTSATRPAKPYIAFEERFSCGAILDGCFVTEGSESDVRFVATEGCTTRRAT